VPEGFFGQVVAFARMHDVVVHDNAYSEIVYDGYVAPPSCRPRRTRVGVFSPPNPTT
jgi:aspartate/methionine/tyrosine aminotransferase